MELFQIKSRFSAAVMFESYSSSLKACLELAIRHGADLSGADLRGVDLRGADLRWANLSEANLSGANLRGAYLRGADLKKAYLRGADLSEANLSGADLSDANLRGADLRGANLRWANLSDANLRGADLSDANLRGADLSGANCIISAGCPNGWMAYGWVREGYLSIRVGCREKRLSEAREYWTGKDGRREVMAALDYIEAVARLRGWAIESS